MGLASLNSSVPWPQTLPLASASCPQNMCPWPQSRVGEKVQTNQLKSITTTEKQLRAHAQLTIDALRHFHAWCTATGLHPVVNLRAAISGLSVGSSYCMCTVYTLLKDDYEQ